VEKLINRIKDERLVPFYQFHQKTFASQKDYADTVRITLESVAEIGSDAESGIDQEQFQLLCVSLDTLKKRMQDFFYDTVNNAIKMCDDTKVLKDLLNMIS
jgi:hypothetical protein